MQIEMEIEIGVDKNSKRSTTGTQKQTRLTVQLVRVCLLVADSATVTGTGYTSSRVSLITAWTGIWNGLVKLYSYKLCTGVTWKLSSVH